MITMIISETDPALSTPHLTDPRSFLSLSPFNDQLLSFQSQNMYELRNALLCLIRFLVYNLSDLRGRSVKVHVWCVPAKIFAAWLFSHGTER